MERPDLSLEVDGARFREWTAQASAFLERYLDSLPGEGASFATDGARLARSLAESMPGQGTPLQELLEEFFGGHIECGLNTASPGYLAFIPGGGLPQSAIAELISNVVNRYVGVWLASPALVQLESNVVRWFCDLLGFPEGSGGYLPSGGSLANFSAVVAARRDRLPDDFLKGTLYVSDQTHHSVLKAALLAGFPRRNVREIATDHTYRISLAELEDRIRRDRKEGYAPFLITGSAGTTNTGAVDDLEALSEIARREGMWLHIDAAYGGFFLLTERGRAVLRGIEFADSASLDPHKGLFIPYGTGSLLVRDQQTLRRAHSVEAHYMPTIQRDDDLVDFCEISPELSRGFRGLRVWLPLKLHGVEPFRNNLDEKLDLIEWISGELKRIPEIEIVAEPQLTVTAFRLRLPGLPPERRDRLNRDFLDRINARRRVHLTGTILSCGFVLRICILSFRTHLKQMREALEDIRAAVPESVEQGLPHR